MLRRTAHEDAADEIHYALRLIGMAQPQNPVSEGYETLVWPLLVELMCAPLPPGIAVRGTVCTNEREAWFASLWGGHTDPPVVVAPLAQEGDGVLNAIVQDERPRLEAPTTTRTSSSSATPPGSSPG